MASPALDGARTLGPIAATTGLPFRIPDAARGSVAQRAPNVISRCENGALTEPSTPL